MHSQILKWDRLKLGKIRSYMALQKKSHFFCQVSHSTKTLPLLAHHRKYQLTSFCLMDNMRILQHYVKDYFILAGCAKFTGGSVFYYPGFTATRPEDEIKFSSELSHLLSRPLGLEAVLRVRASHGIKMTAFHGNFFLRSTDLLSLPNVNPGSSFAVEMSIVETLSSQTACFQTALLHTSSNGNVFVNLGERRIRVMTLALPVTTSMSEIYMRADQIAIAGLLAKKAVERALTSKIEDAREALFYKLTEMLALYKSTFNQSTHSAQLLISDNLKLLPILILGLIKNVVSFLI